MALLSAEVIILTSFQDADPMGIIYHGNYFRYFEEARRALMDKIGYGYLEMKASGFMFPLSETHVKFIQSIRFQHRIRVVADLEEFENRILVRYAIYDVETGKRLTKAHTTQVTVRMDTGELCLATPEALRERLRSYSE